MSVHGVADRRAISSSVLVLSLALLGVGIGFVIYQISLPRPEFAEIGDLSDFQPSSQPYEVKRGVHAFVVNDGKGLWALDPLPNVGGGYPVHWYADDRVFIDPNTEAQYNLHGEPVRWAEQPLRRYALKIVGEKLWVDLSR